MFLAVYVVCIFHFLLQRTAIVNNTTIIFCILTINNKVSTDYVDIDDIFAKLFSYFFALYISFIYIFINLFFKKYRRYRQCRQNIDFSLLFLLTVTENYCHYRHLLEMIAIYKYKSKKHTTCTTLYSNQSDRLFSKHLLFFTLPTANNTKTRTFLEK